MIERYFVGRQPSRPDVVLAAGDDCALVEVPAGYQVAISTDSVVAGTHFLANADPAAIAHKALASNLSDLAAMGATPAWVSLALTLPNVDEAWLSRFCDAFFALADQHQLQLIGGDTTKGPLAITLTVQGLVPVGQALRRSGASVGDGIYVTGSLGEAKAGLDVILHPDQHRETEAQTLVDAHYFSEPRVAIGQALRGLASAAIDISDGLIADLGHILERSQCGAKINISQLPISASLAQFLRERSRALQYALTSGEEYELCFTAAADHDTAVMAIAQSLSVPITRIGEITQTGQIELHDDGAALDWQLTGFDHFKDENNE
nr:thiamine-phosphate kinase [Vibrio agarilyticus]